MLKFEILGHSDELLMTTAASRLGRPNGDGKASSSSSESCHSSSHLPGNSMTHHLEDDPHAVGQWLQFLQMDMYLQGFIDNGYDDFETIKQVSKEFFKKFSLGLTRSLNGSNN